MSDAEHITNRTADNWDDLRVPATAALGQGANPPTFELFKNNDSGPVDKSIRFELGDFAEIPANSIYTVGPNDAKSLAFWIKPDSIQSNTFDIIYRPGSWGARGKKQGTQYVLEAFVDGGPYQVIGVLPLNARSFFALGATSVSGDITFTGYYNGQIVFQQTVTKTSNNVPIYFGANDNQVSAQNTVGTYRGLLDEIVFYQGDITAVPTLVDQLYNNGNGVTVPPEDASRTLISDWECNTIIVPGYYVPDEEGVENLIMGFGDGTFAPSLDDEGLIVTNSSIGVYTYKFLPTIRSDLFFTAQIPHSYKLNSVLRPHLHFSFDTDVAGDVLWGVELIGAVAFADFPATTTILEQAISYTAKDRHIPLSLGDYPGFSVKSAQILGRIFRDGSDDRDTYPSTVSLFEFDFHILQDRVGTLIEF